MADGQYGAYGGEYHQEQYAPAQYAYPKKKFPITYIIIIALIAVLGIVVGGYFLGIFGGQSQASAVAVIPAALNIQAAAGQESEATVTILNPTNKVFSTTIDSSGLPTWISIDKNTVTLNPGESTKITLTMSPSISSEEGSFFVYFSNTPTFVTVKVSILPPPDLRLTLSKSSMQLYQGDKGNVLVTTNNIGQSPGVNALISISGINEDWISFANETFTIAPAEEKSIPISFDIPSTASTGVYESIITVKGIGFSKSIPFTLSVSSAVGLLTVSPDDISGARNSGEVMKLTVQNDGNADLSDVNITTTGTIGQIASFSTKNIDKLGAGQRTEVGMTLSGTNGTYTGSIEITALDTHQVIQSQIITASVVLT
jgi:uncharacterized membrane protein